METRELKHLSALSLIVLLILLIKAGALLQYWQQTRHILLWLDASELRWQHWLGATDANANANANASASDEFIQEADARMRLASQLLLQGEAAIPKPEPVIIKEQVIVKEPAPAVACELNNPDANRLAENQQQAAPLEPSTTANAIENTSTINTAETPTVNATDGENQTTESGSLPPPASIQPLPLNQDDRVLLIGDSMMQGVAPHIASSLRRKYKIDSLNLSTQNTGLTYPSYFDWPAHVDEALASEHYAAIVVLMGANDTWDMLQSGHYIKFNSDNWRQNYSERIEHILATAEAKGTAVFWLSAPPMGREDLVGRVPVINELYQRQLAKHPKIARFISTAETLTADGKTFSKFLELPGRGSVMVRSDDGVHFTTQGQKLLAKLVLDQFSFPEAKPKLTQNP